MTFGAPRNTCALFFKNFQTLQSFMDNQGGNKDIINIQCKTFTTLRTIVLSNVNKFTKQLKKLSKCTDRTNLISLLHAHNPEKYINHCPKSQKGTPNPSISAVQQSKVDRLFHLFVLSIFRVGLLQHCIGTALHLIARSRANFHLARCLARSRITQFPQRGSVRGDSVRIDLPNVSQNVYLLKGVSGPRKFRAGIANSFFFLAKIDQQVSNDKTPFTGRRREIFPQVLQRKCVNCSKLL